MQFLDLSTLIFLVAAVFIFLRLRSVLGQRTGHERPPYDPYSVAESEAEADAGNVVSLPNRNGRRRDDDLYADIDTLAKPGTDVNAGLRAIRDADPSFAPREFLDGAKMAYEMIVLSFADGDRDTLRNLLSRDVYDGFVAAIDEREQKGERMQSSFVGIREAEIVGASVKDHEAHVTLRIVSEMISSTVAADGAVVEGDPDQVEEVRDVWTFTRDTRSRDPNWKLDATEVDD